MRNSATHLVVAFCTSMAVSAAPISPLPLVSPAVFPRSVLPRAEFHEVKNTCRDSDKQNKKCVGGFAYHNTNSEGVQKRDTIPGGQEKSGSSQLNPKTLDDDSELDIDQVQDSDTENSDENSENSENSDHEYNYNEDSVVERRSAFSIFNRSPTPYPKIGDGYQHLSDTDDESDGRQSSTSSSASSSAYSSEDEDNRPSTVLGRVISAFSKD